MLPFIYTHLVSASSALYLFFTAFTKGLYYHPDASLTFGIVLPFLSVTMATLITFGVLEVGNTVLDPFGDDAEDFALLHFVEYALCASCEAIKVKPCGTRLSDRKNFYSIEEVAAAKKVVRQMIKRFRWLKLVKRASISATLSSIDVGLSSSNIHLGSSNSLDKMMGDRDSPTPRAKRTAQTAGTARHSSPTRNSRNNMSLMF